MRAATLPILVLQDLGEEMRPWRRRVDGLLDGLQARGVALDRWTFDTDGSRLFRGREDPPMTLRQLARRSADSPLLVISTGQGVLEGEAFRAADWVERLRQWRSRAWLHPLADRRYWRGALREAPVDVWPMTPDGLVGAARQLSRGESRLGERSEPRGMGERPVTPLDVQRLRWLISLAPSRDPLLAERLRQRFCPHVPASALAEALVAPPSTEPPPVGPEAEEVHAFLAEVLAESRPREEDRAAFDRWRVDHALQLVGAGRPPKAWPSSASRPGGRLPWWRTRSRGWRRSRRRDETRCGRRSNARSCLRCRRARCTRGGKRRRARASTAGPARARPSSPAPRWWRACSPSSRPASAP